MKPYQDRKEYFKNYYKEHRGDRKRYYKRTKEEKRELRNEYALNYYRKNAEKIKEQRRLRYEQEKIPKKYTKSLNKIIIEYSNLHKEEIKLLKQQWRKEKEKLYQHLYFQKNRNKIYNQRKNRNII